MADKNTQATGATVEKTQVLTAEEQKKLKEVLQEFHPLYRHYLKSWKMYLDSYRGGAYVKGYIYKHIRESDQSVTSRRNKSVYPNYIRPIVGLYLSYIFRRTINRKVSKEEEETENKQTPLATEVAEFWDNCDMRGTPINKYMKNVGTLAKIFGHVAMIVDMPAPKDEEGKAIQIKNEAERKKLGIRPYLALYTPVDIVNWEVDSVGNLDWIRFYEELPMEVSPFVKEKERQRSTGVQRMEGAELAVGATPAAVAGGVQTISAPESVTPRAPVFFSRKGTPIKRYTTWTKTSWYIYEIKREKQGSTTKEVVELVDSGDHNLGEVPVVFVYHEKDTLDATVGLSFLQDIAPLNILIMNWLSLLDEEICQKTLNILTMQGDPGAEVTIGSNNVLTYEGDQAPGFIAPAATPGEMMLQAIEKARDEIYRLAKLTGGVSELKEMRSGVAFCLAGDTPIDIPRDLEMYPNGIPIAELAEAYAKKDKPDLYVYGYDHSAKRIALRKILDVWKSGVNQRLLKIEYKWYEKGELKTGSVRVTPAHKVMLRNGSYKKAMDLKIGDSLMPFGRELKFRNYAILRLVGIGILSEHRFIMSELGLLNLNDKDKLVHHRSKGGLDNRVWNLEVMPRLKHAKLHMQSPETVGKISETMKEVRANWTDEQYNDWREKQKVGYEAFRNTPQYLEWCAKISERQKAYWANCSDETFNKRCILSGFVGGSKQFDPDNKPWQNKDILYQRYFVEGCSMEDLGKEWGVHPTSMLYWFGKYGLKQRTRGEAFLLAKSQGKNILPTYFGEHNPNYKHGSYCQLENHKVIAIEPDAIEDVYDMSVEGIHNFVANGIVLHNSYSFQETETTLADTADELEAAEEKIHNLWYRWMDAEWSGIIDYPDEFGIEDVLADLKVLENSMAMVSSPTFKIEVEKKIADKILPKADKDMLSNIFQEITDLVMEEMENLKAEREAQIVGMQQQGQVDEEGNPIETNKALKKDKKLPGNPKVGKTPLSEA